MADEKSAPSIHTDIRIEHVGLMYRVEATRSGPGFMHRRVSAAPTIEGARDIALQLFLILQKDRPAGAPRSEPSE